MFFLRHAPPFASWFCDYTIKFCLYSFLFLRIPLACQWIGRNRTLSVVFFVLCAKVFSCAVVFHFSISRHPRGFFNNWLVFDDLCNVFILVFLLIELLDPSVKIRRIHAIGVEPRGAFINRSVMAFLRSLIFFNLSQLDLQLEHLFLQTWQKMCFSVHYYFNNKLYSQNLGFIGFSNIF